MINKQKKQSKYKVMQSDVVELYRKALSRGIKISQVEKKINRHLSRLSASEDVEEKEAKLRDELQKKKLPKIVRFGALVLPISFLIIGFYLVGSAVLPIIGSYVVAAKDVQTGSLTAPIPESEVMDVTPLVITQNDNSVKEDRTLEIIDEELDYTNLANWFTAGKMPELNNSQTDSEITEYILDIPKLNIKNAVVKVGGTDLSKSLIAYKGTALPGNAGAPVIFGHSILRKFYNPSESNPRRYNSIFSTIMTLKTGDKIFVTSGGVKYTYVVSLKEEVQPDDVEILLQKFDVKQLKLVTCVPEGTYLRRGIITAQLVETSSLK